MQEMIPETEVVPEDSPEETPVEETPMEETPQDEIPVDQTPMALIFQRNADAQRSVPPTMVRPITQIDVHGKSLTDQMKRDNWQLYVLARSNDPTVMVPNTRKLISNLVQSAKRMKDWSRNTDLVFAIKTSQEAWYEYSEEKNWGYAVQLCETVIDRIGDLLYESDWAMGQSGSFAGPGHINTGVKK